MQIDYEKVFQLTDSLVVGLASAPRFRSKDVFDRFVEFFLNLFASLLPNACSLERFPVDRDEDGMLERVCEDTPSDGLRLRNLIPLTCRLITFKLSVGEGSKSWDVEAEFPTVALAVDCSRSLDFASLFPISWRNNSVCSFSWPMISDRGRTVFSTFSSFFLSLCGGVSSVAHSASAAASNLLMLRFRKSSIVRSVFGGTRSPVSDILAGKNRSRKISK